MIITCDCGERRHIHKGYLPDEGETEPIVCAKCDKEYELYRDRSGIHLQEVDPDPEAHGRRRGEF
jgi:hypothetical protein